MTPPLNACALARCWHNAAYDPRRFAKPPIRYSEGFPREAFFAFPPPQHEQEAFFVRFLPQHEPSPENVRTALLAANTAATAMTMQMITVATMVPPFLALVNSTRRLYHLYTPMGHI